LKVLYLTFLVIFSDQLSKLLVKGFSVPFLGFYHQGMDIYSSIVIFDDFLKITYVENPGMAFGLNFGGNYLFCFLRMALAIVILYYLYKMRTKRLLLRAPLALILGGAIGNLIDRIFYGILYNEAPLFFGNVVDFINVKFFKIDFLGFYSTRWPVFNISDIAITVGVIILIVFYKKVFETENNNSKTNSNISETELPQSISNQP